MKSKITFITLAFIFSSFPLLASRPAAKQTERTELSFKNVSKFFADTLHHRPTEVQKRCVIYYEGEWKDANTYDYCVILVENSDKDIQVTFYITDDREMNWVNEFIDGPFFDRHETEQLFGLLHGEHNTRAQKVGRFRVDVGHWTPRHAEIIVLSFTPLHARP